MTITTKQLSAIAESGGDVRTTSGDKIGSIGQIYVDLSTGEPSWVTVRTGLFGMSESFVPLEGTTENGKDIMVNYDKETAKDARRCGQRHIRELGGCDGSHDHPFNRLFPVAI